MTDETDTTSEVARVLGEHYPDQTSYDAGDLHGCMGCGWEVPRPRSNDTDDWEAYWAHQAAMLAEAGLLRPSGTDHLAEDLRENTEALMQARAQVERARTAMRNPNGYFYVADLMPDLRRALEDPQIAAQEPAGATQGGSGDSRASGGLGERLRALGTGQTRTLRKVLRAMADEADRLEEALRSTTHQLELEQDDVCVAHGTVRPCRHCAYAAAASEGTW